MNTKKKNFKSNKCKKNTSEYNKKLMFSITL